MTRAMWAWCGAVLLASSLGAPVPAMAQDSRSAALATDLATQLAARKLDSLAASLGGDEWVGALSLSGSQLLVVRGMYSGPVRLDALLRGKAYREFYINLNSASDPSTKVLISDVGADGLTLKRQSNAPADRADIGLKSYTFDGDWSRVKLSEDEYSKAFRLADEQYAQMLQALLEELRKGP